MTQDKQLRGVSLEAVIEKRRLDQALNAKEFAVLAGISYSSALEWFRVPGFPVFRGFVFWQDFTEWRRVQAGLGSGGLEPRERVKPRVASERRMSLEGLPPRAVRILLEDR
ncbi:MAG TPA: hypothetical protein P5205_19630 [Candidatus Paceibacterota bacterium]|nr:hypothetical protein [Verrucomicrobiota bacterium]HSA12577.1 hypothetical protein [Candidatus Paceibacterota bacterium]